MMHISKYKDSEKLQQSSGPKDVSFSRGIKIAHTQNKKEVVCWDICSLGLLLNLFCKLYQINSRNT